MTPKKENTVKYGSYLPILVAVIGAIGGGFGGTYLLLDSGLATTSLQTVARPDPYTGTQGRALESVVTRHIDNHPDATNHFERRIATLEAQIGVMIRNQERILDRLERP